MQEPFSELGRLSLCMESGSSRRPPRSGAGGFRDTRLSRVARRPHGRVRAPAALSFSLARGCRAVPHDRRAAGTAERLRQALGPGSAVVAVAGLLRGARALLPLPPDLVKPVAGDDGNAE